jgi:hypothetical protein
MEQCDFGVEHGIVPRGTLWGFVSRSFHWGSALRGIMWFYVNLLFGWSWKLCFPTYRRHGLDEFLELCEMVEVVAGHGFYDCGEGHGSALGMGDRFTGSTGRGVADQDQVPLAHGGEGG